MLKDQALTYSRIRNRSTHNTKLNDAIFDLQRIKTFPGYIFLLPLFHDDNISDAQRLKILKMVSVFMLRRHICEYRTGELDEIFSKLINKLEGDNIIEQVRLALIDDTPLDNEFKLKFEKATYKGNVNRAKYVLEQFEYDKMGSTGELKINSGSDVHLEHIIPQTITTKKSKREFGDWEEYLGSEAKLLHKEYVDTIGNYTLLGQKLNIVASNNPFSDKLKEYAKSSIKITQEIVENYNDFKFNDLKQRSKELADYAPKIWKL
ncbi:HNH endonuclease family protein [Gaetbulibacter saemankumensis]|uniref:HNH endonuclease family protein n=1 Tax=Gaetbulibacter saemankumensis TaxID=311208 RepID=UPI00373FC71C